MNIQRIMKLVSLGSFAVSVYYTAQRVAAERRGDYFTLFPEAADEISRKIQEAKKDL